MAQFRRKGEVVEATFCPEGIHVHFGADITSTLWVDSRPGYAMIEDGCLNFYRKQDFEDDHERVIVEEAQ